MLFVMLSWSSCKEKTEDDALPASGESIQFNTLLGPSWYFPVQSVEAVSANGRYLAIKYRENVRSQVMIYDKQADKWTALTGEGNDGQAVGISNDGQVLLFRNDRYYLSSGEQLNRLERKQQWDQYYLSSGGMLVWMQNSNSSARDHILLGRSPGSGLWDTIDPNWKGGQWLGEYSGRLAFERNGKELLWLNPLTKQFTSESYDYDFNAINRSAGLNRKSQPYLGRDGNLYMAGFSGYARIETGNVSYNDWPEGYLFYQNPMDFDVSASGEVFALLGAYDKEAAILRNNGNAWEEVSVFDPLISTLNRHCTLWEETLWMPGMARGSLSYGLVELNLTNNQKSLHGLESIRSEWDDALRSSNGILLIQNGILVKRENSTFTPENEVKDINILLETSDKIIAFGKDKLYTSTDNGSSWSLTEDYLGTDIGQMRPQLALQLDDGRYFLICTSSRSYYNTSTGVTSELYTFQFFQSNDLQNWQPAGNMNEISGKITCIDRSGKLFRKLDLVDPIRSTAYTKVERSDDFGQSWKEVDIATPHVSGPSQTLYSLDAFRPGEGQMRYWNGSEWFEYATKSNVTGGNYFGPVQSARLGRDGKLQILSNDMLFEAERAF